MKDMIQRKANIIIAELMGYSCINNITAIPGTHTITFKTALSYGSSRVAINILIDTEIEYDEFNRLNTIDIEYVIKDNIRNIIQNYCIRCCIELSV